jgi:hypothetical protein
MIGNFNRDTRRIELGRRTQEGVDCRGIAMESEETISEAEAIYIGRATRCRIEMTIIKPCLGDCRMTLK